MAICLDREELREEFRSVWLEGGDAAGWGHLQNFTFSPPVAPEEIHELLIEMSSGTQPCTSCCTQCASNCCNATGS